tara:strand:- start:395 stop:919 length:525 start_codon:yes stop_codon:yes gene_type:complete
MTVRIEKPAFNLRSKLNDLDYGVVPLEKMPAGSIIQYNYDTGVGQHFTTTNGSWTDLSWSVSISPRFDNSLILVELSSIGQQPNTIIGASAVTIYRNNTTNIGDTSNANMGLSAVGCFQETGYITVPQTFFVFDKPNTTDNTSYNLWGRTTNGGTAYCIHSGVTRTLSVKEIKQ